MVGDGPNDAIALRAADVGIFFNEDSSPAARKVAKVLVNDLADLVTLVQSARRTESGIKVLAIGRALALVATIVAPYAWLLDRVH
jgi:P-type E1-E2 ATPase